MTLKEFYLKNYPTDELGVEINETSTFTGLLHALYEGNDVYNYFGVDDSIVRERLFDALSKELKTSYDFIYNLWLK